MTGELFWGAYGSTVSAMLILLMIILMLSMSIRLMLARRKKAYFSLTLSLLFIALQYMVIIALGSRPDIYSAGTVPYLIHALQVLSFIAVNVGIYQLYNTTTRKVRFLAACGTLLTFVILGARYYAQEQLINGRIGSADAVMVTNAFLNIWMDLYLYALLFFCFHFVTPTISQTGKFQSALVVYFLTHSAHVINGYVYGGTSAALTIVEYYLPVAFYAILFQMLFVRVLELMQAVYHSSITDGLTGLYNRNYFMRRLNQFVRSGIPVGVIFCDIDNFKALNDTLGHQRGDEALRQVASIVIDEAEGIGLPGRYGGEEIVMLVSDPKKNPAIVAEKVRARVEAEAGVTVSVGWSKYRKGVTGEKLLKQADEAMYVSKTNGKNRVTGYAAASFKGKGAVTGD